MTYISTYNSPIGEILIAANETAITGLWFKNQKYYALNLDKDSLRKDTEIILLAKKWLDIYFKKEEPLFNLPIYLKGTQFQNRVWDVLKEIPYGKTITYKDIQIILERKYLSKVSCQAIGTAVGHNPISIIVPCHRVIGTNGSLKGYAAGLDKKEYLLALENQI